VYKHSIDKNTGWIIWAPGNVKSIHAGIDKLYGINMANKLFYTDK
jgi:hypothetical protein